MLPSTFVIPPPTPDLLSHDACILTFHPVSHPTTIVLTLATQRLFSYNDKNRPWVQRKALLVRGCEAAGRRRICVPPTPPPQRLRLRAHARVEALFA